MLCPTGSPKVVGGAERLWAGTVGAINELSEHRAEIVEVLAPESSFAELVESYSRFSALDLDHFDMVISGKYPAWMVRHRCHVVYMCHVLRGLYDTYPSAWPISARPVSASGRDLLRALTELAPAEPGARAEVLAAAIQFAQTVPGDHPDHGFPAPLSRAFVHWLDRDAMHSSRIAAHLAISRTVACRVGYFPADVDVKVVVPPSQLKRVDVERPQAGGRPFFFTASRLDGPKRIDLIIDAMRHVASPVELHIAGTGPLESALRQRARSDDRIRFLGRVSDEELAAEYAGCLAVPFVPKDEDLGLITLEAQMAAKAVVTCTDSGGSVELVEHLVDGLVVEPDARSLGSALSMLANDGSMAATMGARGRVRAATITWHPVVDALLEPFRHPSSPASEASRPQVIALSTYAAHPARHGGQVRLARLLGRLAERADVHLVCLATPGATSGWVSPGFWQSVVDTSVDGQTLEARLGLHIGVPTGDIVAALTVECADVLRTIVHRADAIVLEQPYLFPAVRASGSQVPIVYDAQNAEWILKQSMYPATPAGRALADAVADVEGACVRAADLIVAVSSEDLDLLRSLNGSLGEQVVVFNGADVVNTAFVTGDERRRRRVEYLMALAAGGWDHGTRHVALFVGSAHPPNLDAAARVVAAAAQMPDVLFVLVGSHADALIGLPMGPNVLARGMVDTDEFTWLLSLCDVALNPMATGSGTNIKMIDYFAAGAPVVSSSVGARGLPVVDHQHLRLADDDLVAVIRDLVDDGGAADRMAATARDAAAVFDWGRLGDAFAEAVMSVIASGGLHPSDGTSRSLQSVPRMQMSSNNSGEFRS